MTELTKIIVGFAVAGLVAAIAVLTCALIGVWSDYLVIICPPALELMDDEPSHFWLMVHMANIAATNAALYGLLGLGVSKLWGLSKRKKQV